MAKTKAEQEAKKKAKAEADHLAKARKEGLKATETLMKKISKNCPTCKVPIEKRYELIVSGLRRLADGFTVSAATT